MKLFNLLAIALVFAFGANVFAQPAAAPKGIKITKITGTVNIMKDGQVVMTLKPGDAIPEITDNKVTFAIIDGTVEVEAGGKKISAATGSNFTVATTNGQTNVSLGAGTPVAVKTESGNNIILTANSEVKMVTANGKMQIPMEKGHPLMNNASGGETQTMTVGQAVSITAEPMAPVAAQPVMAPTEATGTELMATEPVADAPLIIPVIQQPLTSIIPTQTVTQACTVSASSPDCI